MKKKIFALIMAVMMLAMILTSCIQNDISVKMKKDGTGFIQLTYHPADDCCPVWSNDGKYIYFISSRANERDAFNIWKMRFEL